MASGELPASVVTRSDAAEQTSDKLKSACECVNDTSEEFQDELQDLAKPLTPVDDDYGCDRPTGGGGGKKLAKDKRKLREKRRSTGVVQYTTESADPTYDSSNAADDVMTSLNTTHNEFPENDTINGVGIDQLTLNDTVVAGSQSTDVTVTSRTKPANETSNPAVRGILTNRTLPTVPPKPKVLNTSIGASHGFGKPSNQPLMPRPESDRQLLLNRLTAVEKLLDGERKENVQLREQLSRYEARIAELETEVEALNKDLDLADEDCAKLEQENDVLIRAISRSSANQC